MYYQLKQQLFNNFWYEENSRAQNRFRHLRDLGFQERVKVLSTIQPNYSKVWGIDISPWNGLTDLATAKANGCSFVIIKACDGTVTSNYFQENKARAKAAGLLWGVYFWLYPNNRVSVSAQVNAWWNLVKDDYPPMGCNCDIEWTTYGGAAANPVTADANMMQDNWRAKRGSDIDVYTAKGYSDQYLKGFTRYGKLWAAHYGVATPLLPVGVTTYHLHQFTSSLDGSIAPNQNKELDGNYYNGTTEQFNIEYNLGGTPMTDRYTGTIATVQPSGSPLTALSLRSSPQVSPNNANFVTSYAAGSPITGSEIVNDTLGFETSPGIIRQWLKISSVNNDPSKVGYMAYAYLNVVDNQPATVQYADILKGFDAAGNPIPGVIYDLRK